MDRIDPPQHLGVLRKQSIEDLGRDPHHQRTEDREESIDVKPYGEDCRAVLDIVDYFCVLSEVIVALAKSTMADDVCG